MSHVSRRSWMQLFTALGAGTCLCGGSGGCATFTKKGSTPELAQEAYTLDEKAVRIVLSQVPELTVIGGAVKITNPALKRPIIVVCSEKSCYHAASLLCPHRGVEVEYQPGQKRFRCASLGHSTFGLSGAKQSGFAKQGLHPYTVKGEADGVLVIALA